MNCRTVALSFTMLTLVLTVDAMPPGSFTPTPDPMTSPRALHRAIPLLDGRVLITGGIADLAAQGNVPTAEIFDPTVDPVFQEVNEINTTCPNLSNPGCPVAARAFHRATLLLGGALDGKVLITGGDSRGGGRYSVSKCGDLRPGNRDLQSHHRYDHEKIWTYRYSFVRRTGLNYRWTSYFNRNSFDGGDFRSPIPDLQ